jgi:hypothetical protein
VCVCVCVCVCVWLVKRPTYSSNIKERNQSAFFVSVSASFVCVCVCVFFVSEFI